MHGHEGALAPRGGAQVGVVGRDGSHLDRERDGEAAPGDAVHHAAHRLDSVPAGQRVLHLGEANQTRARKDGGGAFHALRAACEARHGPVQRRDRAGNAAARAAEQLERAVREQDVACVGGDAGTRPRGPVGAVVRARQCRARVREDEELEMVVGERQLLEALESVLERGRRVDAVQRKRRHAAKRHLRDHTERAESHARGGKHVRILLRRALQRGAVGEHERQRGDL